MASGTERDQVVFEIISAPAAEFLVVDLQIRSAVAALTSPSIAAQDLSSELLVQLRSSRRRGRLGRIQLTRLAESMPTSLPYIVFDCPFWKQLAYLLNAPLFPHPGSFLFLFSERFFLNGFIF